MFYDIAIIGGGPAGLSAAIFAARRGLKTILVTEDLGGQAATTEEIENYPGVTFSGGRELMEHFWFQAEHAGAERLLSKVRIITENITATDGYRFSIETTSIPISARALILSFGITHRHLQVLGESIFTNKGVSYCASCDAPHYVGKSVAVIGGGNSALTAALLLAKTSKTVTLVHRGSHFTGEAPIIERVTKTPNIIRLTNAQVREIHGESFVTGITLVSVDDATRTKKLDVEGVFIEIGFESDPSFIEGFVDLDERRHIIIQVNGQTSRPGVFAAGDATTIPYKQIVISAGEGAKSALAAYDYLRDQGYVKQQPATDWGRQTITS